MKKILFIVIVTLMTCFQMQGQEYAMKINLHFLSDDDNIEASSHYTLNFYNQNGDKVLPEYYENINGIERGRNWYAQVYVKCSASNPITKIVLYADHRDNPTGPGNDKQRGEKTTEHPISLSLYPCGTYEVQEELMGSGDKNSTMTVELYPLSLSWIIKEERSDKEEDTDRGQFLQVFFEDGEVQTFSPELGEENQTWLTKPNSSNIIKLKSAKYRTGFGTSYKWYYADSVSYTNGLTDNSVVAITTTEFTTQLTLKKAINNLTVSPQTEKLLFEDSTYLSTGEFHDTHEWLYSTDSLQTWINIPGSTTSGSVQFTGESLLGDDFVNYISKNIFFKAKYPCSNSNGETAITTLNAMLSSPHIDSVSYQLPTCHGNADAKLLVYFDRELYDGEKLYISTNGDRFTDPAVFNSGTKVLEIPNLAADTFNISLLGTYIVGTTTVNTYTDGTKHKYSIRIPDRPALSINQISQSAVHCYVGSDGKITLSASGGIGTFDALLDSGGIQVDSIRFTSSEQGIFEGLKAGTYTVNLIDTNGCRWDSLGNEVTKQIEVTHPSQRVSIVNYQSQEPTGYGLSDGWAQVRFTGGTSGSYVAVWKDSLGNVVSNTITQEGDTYISKATDIKSSTYFVSVFDTNYSSADPQTDENTCGCTDTISFFVTEPTKLEVVIEEYHYVTCNGDEDGAIVAHATGGRPFTSGLPYTYQWSKIENGNTSAINQTDSIISGLTAGTYRVVITDRNGIIAASDDYQLVEPEVLTVATQVIQNIICSGDSIGIIQATASGGTPPYTYIWSTNDTTAVVTGLPEGKYVVGVRDARYKENIMGHYCFAQAYDSIVSTNPIKLNAEVKNPACFGYTNGAITLHVTGGTAPYNYYWEDGSTLSERTNLIIGNYNVRVTDASGCFSEENYSLTEPDEITIDLGKDIVLCKDQSLTLNGGIDLSGISYKWTDDSGNELSDSSSYVVNKAGTYHLIATTPEGCSGSDEINIETSDDEADPDFVVASQIANETKVYAVNITQSTIDSVSWIIPDEATVWEKLNDRLQFEFSDNGCYTIGMTVYKNKCSCTLYKTVQVVDKEDVKEDTSDEPFIKQFIVSPNPNDGTFQAVVELREPANYSLQLYDSSGKLITSQTVENKMSETTTFNVTSVGSGVFYLKFSSTKETAVFNVLIN